MRSSRLPLVGASLPLAPARAAGNLTAEDEDAVRDVCALISDGVFDDDEGPARIHGDLWNGNVMWTPRGVVMIDPAAHGGHRETDLAMLALFGCPHLDAVLDGYRDAHPLVPGWQDRVDVHQLHPLAVHAAGHGPGYGSSLGLVPQPDRSASVRTRSLWPAMPSAVATASLQSLERPAPHQPLRSPSPVITQATWRG